MADIYKSLYQDIANKKANGLKSDLSLSQKSDGTEVSKPIEYEIMTATALDRANALDAGSFARSYTACTINPYRNHAIVTDGRKAYHSQVDLGQNEAVGADLYNGKSVATKMITGISANYVSISFVYTHQTPSTTGNRAIVNLLLKVDGSVVKPLATISGDFITIRDFSTVPDADTSGVAIKSSQLTVGRTYIYTLVYDGTTSTNGGTVLLYENGKPVYSNRTSTYNSEYIASINAGLSVQALNEGIFSRIIIFNNPITVPDIMVIFNNGKGSIACVPESLRWGSQTTIASGSIIVGKRYRVASLGTGIVVNGIVQTVVGAEITATSATVTWNSGSLIRVGAVVSLHPKGLSIPTKMTTSNGTAEQTALVAGTAYEITTASTTDWTAYGALDNRIETRFIANQTVGTIPNGGKVIPVTIDKQANIGWYDETTNDNDSTVTGSPALVAFQMEQTCGGGGFSIRCFNFDIGTTAGGPTSVGVPNALPPGYLVSHAVFVNLGGSSTTFKVGSTENSGDYLSTQSLTAGQMKLYASPDTNNPFSFTNFSDFYLTSTGSVSAHFRVIKFEEN